MTKYLIDIIIVAVFLYFGIKYIKTKDFDDRRDIYTQESKEKAATVLGVVFIIGAIYEAIITVLKYKEIIDFSSDSFFVSMLPTLGLLVIVVIGLLVVYCGILKKK